MFHRIDLKRRGNSFLRLSEKKKKKNFTDKIMPSFRSERKGRIICLNGGRAHLWDLCFVSLFAGLFFFFFICSFAFLILFICLWMDNYPPHLFCPLYCWCSIFVRFVFPWLFSYCNHHARGWYIFHLIIIFFIMQISRLIMAQADKKKSL